MCSIEGHYTGHFKAVVTKAQNVLVMRDVACAGYVAGCNTQFFNKDGDLADAQQHMEKRLAFEEGSAGTYKSILAFPMWEAQMDNGDIDQVMSVTTRLLPWDTQGAAALHKSFPGGDAMYKAYNRFLKMNHIHFGEDMRAAENMEFISQARLATHFIRNFHPTSD